MTGRDSKHDQFASLNWGDLNSWAGSRIVARGRKYQQEGRVSGLARTENADLISWVDGSERYATRVTIDDERVLDSVCTCPYQIDCKHGVAVVLEYLKRIKKNTEVPGAEQEDERLEMLKDELWYEEVEEDEDDLPNEDLMKDISAYLKGKSREQLAELIRELAGEYPGIACELADRQRISSGNVESVLTRLRGEIRDAGVEPGWQNCWEGEGYTPDYSDIRSTMEELLKAGYADEVLSLGEDLIEAGNNQMMMSNDNGETAMQIGSCMPVVAEGLDQSSLDTADKLTLALKVVLKDNYGIYRIFDRYLFREFPREDWNVLANRMLEQLSGKETLGSIRDFSRDYARDQLTDWTIHALKCAGREEEVITLCRTEAERTNSYERLVRILMSEHRWAEAEQWIRKGIRATRDALPGIAAQLRKYLEKIRVRQKDWPAVAAMKADEFLRYPSGAALTSCRKAAEKIGSWPKVRGCLVEYLESGRLPWKQKGWPFPESDINPAEDFRGRHYPMIRELIEIAILEKEPAVVLHWYDKIPELRSGWYVVDEDSIAAAIQSHAPDRAVSIWKARAEGLIDRVKPSAYLEAADYLRKAARVMSREDREEEWSRYLGELRKEHRRKRRLMEIMDGLEEKPIAQKKD